MTSALVNSKVDSSKARAIMARAFDIHARRAFSLSKSFSSW